MNYWDIERKFNQSFQEANTLEQENKSVRTYIQECTQHGYFLAKHIQGPIKKGPSGWGLRKKDNRVQSDPYSAYNWK
jgi:hypothetical protein